MSQSVTSGSFSRNGGPGGTTRKRRRTLSSPDRLGNTPAGVGSSPSFQAANSSPGCRLTHSENTWSWLQSGRKCLIIQRVTLGKSVRLVVIYIYFTLIFLLKKSSSTLALNSKGWVQPKTFMYLEYVHVHENIFGCVWLSLFCIVFFTLRLPSSDLKYETAAHVCATTPHTDRSLSVSVYSCEGWVWKCVKQVKLLLACQHKANWCRGCKQKTYLKPLVFDWLSLLTKASACYDTAEGWLLNTNTTYVQSSCRSRADATEDQITWNAPPVIRFNFALRRRS